MIVSYVDKFYKNREVILMSLLTPYARLYNSKTQDELFLERKLITPFESITFIITKRRTKDRYSASFA